MYSELRPGDVIIARKHEHCVYVVLARTPVVISWLNLYTGEILEDDMSGDDCVEGYEILRARRR